MYKGESKIDQEGANGEKIVTYRIVERNGQQVHKEVKEEQVVKEPVTKIIRKGTKVIPSRGSGELIWPTIGGLYI